MAVGPEDAEGEIEAFQELAGRFMEHATQLAAASIHMQMLMFGEALSGLDQSEAASPETDNTTEAQDSA